MIFEFGLLFFASWFTFWSLSFVTFWVANLFAPFVSIQHSQQIRHFHWEFMQITSARSFYLVTSYGYSYFLLFLIFISNQQIKESAKSLAKSFKVVEDEHFLLGKWRWNNWTEAQKNVPKKKPTLELKFSCRSYVN